MKAILAGTSGAVGKQILYEWLSQESTGLIQALVRTPLPLIKDRKLKQLLVNWDQPETWPEFEVADCAFCALGTTIKKAKSKEAFRKVDFDYAFTFAEKAKKAGVKTFVLVSAVGANSKSSIFYSKVKGQLELAIEAMGFETLIIAQPGLLITPRKERRIGEQIAQWLSPLLDLFMVGPLSRYHSVSASLLSKSLVKWALSSQEPHGVIRLHFKDFKKFKAGRNLWMKKGHI